MFTSTINSRKIVLCCLAILFAGGSLLVAEIRANPLCEPESIGNVQGWENVPAGLHGAVGSIDRRYQRDKAPATDGSMSWSGTAWQGERVNAQIVLWTSDGAEQVQLTTTPLRRKDGKQLPDSCVRPAFVRYVLADDGSPGCNPPLPTTPKTLVADVLDTTQQLDIPARTTRPVWLSLDVPAEASPGLYRENVNVTAQGGKLLTFEINLEVLPIRLPAPAEWSFHLDLWQNPYSVARYHQVEPWSPEHWDLLEPLLKMLADAGQKCITTSIVYQPWGGQTYDPFDSMVKWVRRPDGTWSFDYTVFDQYVEFCARCGITEQINCYSMVPWTNRFRYFALAGGDYKFLEAEPGTTAYENHWRPFLTDFVRHLRSRGRGRW